MTRRRQKKRDIALFVNKNRKLIRVFSVFLLALLFVFSLSAVYSKIILRFSSAKSADYKPLINVNDFVSGESNKYFELDVNKKLQYEKQSEKIFENVEVRFLTGAEKPLGIEVIILEKTVRREGSPVRSTDYLLASDKNGNVWLFGQNFFEYKGGEKIRLPQSWLAGKKGEQPGIVIKAKFRVGDTYRTAYAPKKIETVSEIVSIDETVVTPSGTYTSCVKIYEWSYIDPKYQKNHFYCPEPGGLVLTVDIIDDTREELIFENTK